MSKTWLIVGASRGIGLEFVKQLLQRGDLVIATVRDAPKAADLWTMAGRAGGRCQLLYCDVSSDESINVSWVPLFFAATGWLSTYVRHRHLYESCLFLRHLVQSITWS